MPEPMSQPPTSQNTATITATITAQITALYRYPVKGLTPEPLREAVLSAGGTMPFDRAYAIENGPGPFDAAEPKHLPKLHFVMLMRNQQLASVRARFDTATTTLHISKDGSDDVSGNLETPEGRRAIEDYIASLVGDGMRGAPRIVAAPGHSFSDVAAKCLHVINLETVRALEQAIGAPINPLRFRPNVIIDGWPAWSEFDCIGKTLTAGAVSLDVFKRTERCAATNVDPATGTRDMKIPSFLSRTFGHTDFGVYARVATAGTLRLADAVSISEPPMA